MVALLTCWALGMGRYAMPDDKAEIDRHIGHYLEYRWVSGTGNTQA